MIQIFNSKFLGKEILRLNFTIQSDENNWCQLSPDPFMRVFLVLLKF